MATPHPKGVIQYCIYKEHSLVFVFVVSVLSHFGISSSLWTVDLVMAISAAGRQRLTTMSVSGRVQHTEHFVILSIFSNHCADVMTKK